MKIRNFLLNRITLNVLAGILLAVALFAGTKFMLGRITHHNQEITVPDMTNMSVAEAEKTASEYGIKLDNPAQGREIFTSLDTMAGYITAHRKK